MTVTTLEIIQADKQLWREYLSNRTSENKAKIESYEKQKWILVSGGFHDVDQFYKDDPIDCEKERS